MASIYDIYDSFNPSPSKLQYFYLQSEALNVKLSVIIQGQILSVFFLLKLFLFILAFHVHFCNDISHFLTMPESLSTKVFIL